MKFSYQWLKELVDIKISPQRLAGLLTSHAFEVESIEKKDGDSILHIATPANRPDSLGYWWVAREVSAIIKSRLYLPELPTFGKTRDTSHSSAIKVPSLCSRLVSVRLDNVEVGPAPAFISKRLVAGGIKSINNIVDITNYVMLETGQPTHAFDLDRIVSGHIEVRLARRGEKITTLDDKERKLSPDVLVIADRKAPLDIAGIMGGKLSGISADTRNILLTAARFDPVSVRRTSRKYGMRTEASLRFERGISPVMPMVAAERVAELLRKYSGGHVVSAIDTTPKRQNSDEHSIKLDTKKISSILGIKIKDRIINDLLKRLGFSLKNGGVTVPFWRTDISSIEDLAEEVGRIIGYHNIPKTVARTPYRPQPMDAKHTASLQVRELLVRAGMTEVSNYSFYSPQDADKINLPLSRHLTLANPVSSEYSLMRMSLLPGLLRNTALNQQQASDIKMFELGNVYTPSEVRVLGIILGGKGASVSNLIRTMNGLLAFGFEQKESESGIKVLSKSILQSYGVDMPCLYFESPIEQGKISSHKLYQVIPKFPSIVRDFSIFIDKKVPWSKIELLVRNTGGTTVKMVELFDRYEGKSVPIDKKSLAFHVEFLAPQRTLRDEEVNKVYDGIVLALKQKLGAEIRE